MGHLSWKTRSKELKLVATVFIQISWKMVWKFVLMISMSSLNMGHLGSKNRSHCSNMESHIFDSPVMKLGQDTCLGNCSDEFEHVSDEVFQTWGDKTTIWTRHAERLNWPWPLKDIDCQVQIIAFWLSCHNFVFYVGFDSYMEKTTLATKQTCWMI
jgi:hypothetical protein